MIKNIFTVAFRSLWRQKAFSLINIIGLAFGITACILIFLFIEFETSFDKYHSRANEIYRVVSKEELAETTIERSTVHYPLAHALQMDLADYDITGLFNQSMNTCKVDDKLFQLENVLYVDSVFFKMFDIEWVIGNENSVKTVENSVVLSESLAKTWFNNDLAIGKIIDLNGVGKLQVVGIIKDSPSNSSIPYSIITSYQLINDKMFGLEIRNWETMSSGFECYIAAPDNIDKGALAKRIDEIRDKNDPPVENTKRAKYMLQPLREVHQNTSFVEVQNIYATSPKHIFIFASIGLLILVLACINFVNLATAQAFKKAKEVGIRKVVGAYRKQVFFLFLSETIIMTLFSIFLAFILTELVLPYFNSLISVGSNLSIYQSNHFIYFIILIFILVMLMAGFYPGFVLSRFNPIKVLKAHISKPTAKINIRTVLMVVQFTISIALVICTLIINSQVNYMKNKEMGFKTKNMLTYSIPEPSKQIIERLRNEVIQMPEVKKHTFGFSPPSSSNNFTTNYFINNDTDNNKPNTNVKIVDENYLETYGLELIAGRWITTMNPTDSTYEFVVNEKLLKENNYTPEEAINMHFSIGLFHGKIVGVAKDFHVHDMRSDIGTVIFMYYPQFFYSLMLETTEAKSEALIAKTNKLFEELFPDNIVEYQFLEVEIQSNYERDTRTLKTIQMFSILGIVIALLGLFGLVSYMVTQQTRTIGIRKVLGSSVNGIIRWVSTSYIKMVLVSNTIAWPISYLFMQEWLNQFAFRIDMPWLIFIATAISSIIIAYGTIMLQTLRVSKANPVEAIKYE